MPSKKQLLKSLKGDWTASRIKVSYETNFLNDSSITTQVGAYNIILHCWDKELINLQEQVMAFFFNRRNKLIGYRLISTGSSTQCHIDIKFLVSLALHTMACQVIMAHNHPSGELIPSDSDKNVTSKIKEALDLIDVKLLDHFIISISGYYSFAEQGYF